EPVRRRLQRHLAAAEPGLLGCRRGRLPRGPWGRRVPGGFRLCGGAARVRAGDGTLLGNAVVDGELDRDPAADQAGERSLDLRRVAALEGRGAEGIRREDDGRLVVDGRELCP